MRRRTRTSSVATGRFISTQKRDVAELPFFDIEDEYFVQSGPLAHQ